MKALNYDLTLKQYEAYCHLVSDDNVDLLYGGAKGGGKSWLLCLWVFLWTNFLIRLFKLPEGMKNPLPVGFIGRKQSVDFGDTTLETWKKIIPAENYIIREQDKEIIVGGKAKINFGGLDRAETINKFNSAEYAFFAIDQAEETDRSDISVLEGSLRLKYNGIQPPYKTLYTANPAECWLKQDFLHGGRPKGIFVPALPTDNPHLPDNYIDQLDKAFSYDPVLLQAYKAGNWDVMVADQIVIPSKYIDELRKRVHIEGKIRRCIAVDPSLGGDECVLFFMENYRVLATRILHYDDEMKIVGEIVIMMQEHDTKVVAVDQIGFKGIVDRLNEMDEKLKFKIMGINSAEASTNQKLYKNKRTEMWWNVRKKIMDKAIPYPEDEELRRQLCAPRFKIINSDGRVQVEPKENTKKRIGRSPDRADAFIYGVWCLDHIPSLKPTRTDYREAKEIEDKYANVRGY